MAEPEDGRANPEGAQHLLRLIALFLWDQADGSGVDVRQAITLPAGRAITAYLPADLGFVARQRDIQMGCISSPMALPLPILPSIALNREMRRFSKTKEDKGHRVIF